MTPAPTSTPATASAASPWPRRFALATLLSAVPLLLFGGSVTTMGAGMAVEGWLNAEGHFLPFFPLEKWFRDSGTFVEHTHRQAGIAVGLFAIGLVVSVFLTDKRRSARAMAVAALVVICAQGTLGGFRVLENSPQLAFLHGTTGQLVFAFLCVTAAWFGRAWNSAPRDASELAEHPGRGPRRVASLALVVVIAQVGIGAWYRHALRPTPEPGVGEMLALHLIGAFLTVLVVVALGVMLLGASGARRGVLRATGMRLFGLLGFQVVLGLAAWVTYDAGSIGSGEITTTILHVLGGALLLGQVAVARLWTGRIAVAAPARVTESSAPEPTGNAEPAAGRPLEVTA